MTNGWTRQREFLFLSRRFLQLVKEFLSKHQGLFQKVLHLFKKSPVKFFANYFQPFFEKNAKHLKDVLENHRFQVKKKWMCISTHPFNIIKVVFLLGNNQVVVLLTALNEQVFFIEQIGSSNYLVESSKLFLVQRNTTTLNELTHFAL